MEEALATKFLRSRGAPIEAHGETIVQADSIVIPSRAMVEVKFCGDGHYVDNAVVVSVKGDGRIYLTDGNSAPSVQIWDEVGLPRRVAHLLESKSGTVWIHNKYRIRHRSGLVTEDSYTGNAGMVVTHLAQNRRRYECSNGLGAFSKRDLVFEVSWKKAD